MKKTLNKKINEPSSYPKLINLPKINTKQKIKSPRQQQTSININSNNNTNTNTINKSPNSTNKFKSKIFYSPRKKLRALNIKKSNKNSLKIVASLSNLNEKKLSLEKLEEFKEKRRKRIKQEKEEEEKGLKIYEQILKEIQEKKKNPRIKTELYLSNPLNQNKGNEIIINELPKIKISEKKAQNILEEGGMFDAYKYLLEQLCKKGLPTENVFDYASYVITNYEKKWKEKKYKLNQEKVEKYWKEKKEEIENKNINNNELIKAINRSLEEREMNKLIKSLDRSRSSIHYKSFANLNKKKTEKVISQVSNKSRIIVEQKNFENNKKKTNIKNPSINNKERKSIIINRKEDSLSKNKLNKKSIFSVSSSKKQK